MVWCWMIVVMFWVVSVLCIFVMSCVFMIVSIRYCC